MDRRRVALDEIRLFMDQENIDVAAVQEPYTRLGKVGCFGVGYRIIHCDVETPMAAIIIRSRDIDVMRITQFTTSHIVTALLAGSFGEIYLISVYCQFSEPIQGFLQFLAKILNDLEGKKVLIMGDFNAKSILWDNAVTDGRGRTMEDFITSQNLYVINEPGYATFQSEVGQSCIDLTIASARLVRFMRNWKVLTDITSSHHNTIQTTITSACTEVMNKKRKKKLNLVRADWGLFEMVVEEEVRRTINSDLDVDTSIRMFSRAISKGCKMAIPIKRESNNRLKWWDRDLQKKKTTINRLRRIVQRAEPGSRQSEIMNLRTASSEYRKEVYLKKRRSWVKFLNEHTDKGCWGFPYKLISGQINVGELWSSLKCGEGFTKSLHETLDFVLEQMFPDDIAERDSVEQRLIRESVEDVSDDSLCDEFSYNEVLEAVNKQKAGRSPGEDGMEVKPLQVAMTVVGHQITNIFNGCLRQGMFPKAWKCGMVKILKKGPDKPCHDVRSYRPICLLPVMGKVYERLLANRLFGESGAYGAFSDKQHGFCIGKSIDTALCELRRLVDISHSKYVVGVFVDIRGAFDNVWWPAILARLKTKSCPSNLYQVMKNYFKDRSVKIICNTLTRDKKVTKGCPQGSVLGPNLWNAVIDEYLELPNINGISRIAFADDILLIVSGCSRKETECRIRAGLTQLISWSSGVKLSISKEKTNIVVLKGLLSPRRPICVNIDGWSLRSKISVRYLGVMIGERFRCNIHANAVADKVKKAFFKIRGIAQRAWGLNYEMLLQLYKGIVEPSLTFGAIAWFDKINVHGWRSLRSAQRSCLLTVTRCYRTASYESVVTIAGVLPIKQLVNERVCLVRIRLGLDVEYGNIRIANNEDLTLKQIRYELRSESIRMWNVERRERTTGSSSIIQFFPDIGCRLERMIVVTPILSEYLSGHGDFGSKLFELGLIDSNECECGETDTPDHIMFECPLYDERRDAFAVTVRDEGYSWPCGKSVLVSTNLLDSFRMYVEDLHRLRRGDIIELSLAEQL